MNWKYIKHEFVYCSAIIWLMGAMIIFRIRGKSAFEFLDYEHKIIDRIEKGHLEK